MITKPLIRNTDQVAVELAFGLTRLAATHQQDCRPHRIERESDAPFTISDAEPQFLHFGMGRPVQPVAMRPAQLWSELPSQTGQGGYFHPHCRWESRRLHGEIPVKLNIPSHDARLIHQTVGTIKHDTNGI